MAAVGHCERPLLASMGLVLLCIVGHASATINIGDKAYDHTWHTKNNMPEVRSDMTATTVGNAIYIIGGCWIDQTWVHDPVYSEYKCGAGLEVAITKKAFKYLPGDDRYETLPDAPRGRYRHAAAVVGQKIYVVGGVDWQGNAVSQVDVLDTQAGTWSTFAFNMPTPTADPAAFAFGGKVYVVGGYVLPNYDASKVTYVLNPAGASGSAWYQGPQMIEGRGDTFATIVAGKAYVLGGFTHVNQFKTPLASLEELDVSRTGATWVPKRDIPTARGDKAVAGLNDVLHVVGGETKNDAGHSVPLRDVEVYDPSSNLWYTGGNIPSKRFRFTAAAHGNSIYIFGGQGFLEGTYGTTGSKYPLLSTVEQYKEEVSLVAAGAHALAPSAGVCALLMAILSTAAAFVAM